MKTRAALALLALLMPAPMGHAQVFKDLPGVVASDAREEYAGKDAASCTKEVVTQRNGNTRWMPRDVYVCEQNGLTSSSTKLPPSSIRALRGLEY